MLLLNYAILINLWIFLSISFSVLLVNIVIVVVVFRLGQTDSQPGASNH